MSGIVKLLSGTTQNRNIERLPKNVYTGSKNLYNLSQNDEVRDGAKTLYSGVKQAYSVANKFLPEMQPNMDVAEASAGILGSIGLDLPVKILAGIYLITSLVDIGIDTIDAIADATTVGVSSAIGTPIDIISELILEILQIFIAMFIIYMSEGSTNSKIIKMLILFVLAGVDIIFSVAGLLPYADIPETIGEIMTELVSNILIWVTIF